MSIGSILVGVAVLLFLAAYVARPFRRAEVDLDALIEARVARVRRERSDGAHLCPHCGHHAGTGDRFCAGCGMPLQEVQR
ncbi:MAG: zinc ribbon domain-containing protein [Anaerolineae bacterium]|jgi:hypothetical protein